MAPSAKSPLHPIIIPEIIVPPHFTCLGSCLLQNRHPRETSSSLSTLLLPSPASPRGIPNSAKPKTWWGAQCLHYGIDIPVLATIERMRARLEEGLRGYGGLVVPEYLVDLEHQKCGEFRKLNAQVRGKVNAPASGLVKKPKKEAKNHGMHTHDHEEKTSITTITKTRTTTKKMEKAPTSSRSGGSGGRSSIGVRNAGVSKVKAVKNGPNIRKQNEEYFYNDNDDGGDKDDEYDDDNDDIYHSQQQFLNSTNTTSPQGPLPSYLRQNLPPPTWQTNNTSSAPVPVPDSPPKYTQYAQQPSSPVARYSGSHGGDTIGNNHSGRTTTRSSWTPTGDGKFKQFNAPRGGGRRFRYGEGGSSSVSPIRQYQPQHQHQYHCQFYQPVQNAGNINNPGTGGNSADNGAQPDEPPPAYGSWMDNDNDNTARVRAGSCHVGPTTSGDRGEGGNGDDYSDEEGLGVRYEDFEAVGFRVGGVTGPHAGGISAGGSMNFENSRDSIGNEGWTRTSTFQRQIYDNTRRGYEAEEDEEDEENDSEDYEDSEMGEILRNIIQDAEEQEGEEE